MSAALPPPRIQLHDAQRRLAWSPPPSTAQLPGTGGHLRARAEDFCVQELLGFSADGVADRHLLIELRKVGLNTKDAVGRIARHCRLPAVEFGVAGLKDRHAVTTQWISAPAHARSRLTGFADADITLGPPHPHSAKLRRGHALGNRFIVTVRGAEAQWRARLDAKIEALGGRIANVYGEQRFGHGAKNLDEGLRRLSSPRRARDSDFMVNAAQSGLFNLYLVERRRRGLLEQVLEGDLLLDAKGRLEAARARMHTQELPSGVQLTGPMVGGSVDRPDAQSEAGQLESEILANLGVCESHFCAWGKRVRGARRALCVPFELHALEPAPARDELAAGYTVEFSLPSGSYATALLREFTSPVGADDLAQSDAAIADA